MRLEELAQQERENARRRQERLEQSNHWFVRFEYCRWITSGLGAVREVWESDQLPSAEEGGVPKNTAENLERRLKTAFGNKVRDTTVVYNGPREEEARGA